jgi:hypothetical protein
MYVSPGNLINLSKLSARSRKILFVNNPQTKKIISKQNYCYMNKCSVLDEHTEHTHEQFP